jgi:hypothetical protein
MISTAQHTNMYALVTTERGAPTSHGAAAAPVILHDAGSLISLETIMLTAHAWR